MPPSHASKLQSSKIFKGSDSAAGAGDRREAAEQAGKVFEETLAAVAKPQGPTDGTETFCHQLTGLQSDT